MANWRIPRLKYSLSFLLLATSIIAVVLGVYVQRTREHRDAVRAVRTWKASILYAHQVDYSARRVDLSAQRP